MLDFHWMAREYYIELMERENLFLAFVSCIGAATPAVLALYFLAAAGKIPMMILLSPGIIIGFCAKLGGGKVFRMKVKIIPAITAALAMVITWSLLDFSFIVLVMALPNAIAAYLIRKPKLTKRQAMAKHRVERGLVKL